MQQLVQNNKDNLPLDKKAKCLGKKNGAFTYTLDILEVIHILSLHTVCRDTPDLH